MSARAIDLMLKQIGHDAEIILNQFRRFVLTIFGIRSRFSWPKETGMNAYEL
ncbi:hypothetical protein JIR001_15000 [Polycladomyces abyssicola]|uniref:Uncharacterized protein n=1 Tax=Polycladomyces abyssicola TaxID=1125966 RepID=A0A8D5UEA9_9BACL|nr:hypothetical protein [Polycladomyces abyssicola]BCU81717.1 hypothetical protein JIR001_15000 [Polycladomyces abyssicola]